MEQACGRAMASGSLIKFGSILGSTTGGLPQTGELPAVAGLP